MPGAPATVLLVHSSSGRYGADRQLELIATGLEPARYRPLVVLPARGRLVESLQTAGVPVLVRPLAVIRRELAHPRGVASLAAAVARNATGLGRLVRERDVALIHSNTSVVLGGAAAAALAGVPHLWHVREIYSRFGRLWPPYRRVLATARILPCVSGATAAQFRTSDPVRVLYDAVAGEPSRAPRAAARAALRLGEEPPVVAVLGRISDWKGQDVLIRALAEPALRTRGAVALIAGEAWPGAEERARAVSKLAVQLGVSERVRMVGFREDLETVLGAADVIAVPSTEPDPLPGAALEAAAAGCVVVASAHGGLPEIIREGETGRLVSPGDAAALARVTAELLENPEERERLGSSAALDAAQRFSAERLLEAVHALYDEVLGPR